MARTHYVVCEECRRKFDATREGAYYNRLTNRYTCKSCVRKQKKQEAQKNSDIYKGKNDINLAIAQGKISKEEAMISQYKNSKAKYVWGIIIAAFGLVCLIIGFAMISEGPACLILFFYAVASFVVGGLLIRSYLLKKKKYEAALLTISEKTEAERRAEMDRVRRLQNAPKKCPFCGATTKGSFCEYCGSKL